MECNGRIFNGNRSCFRKITSIAVEELGKIKGRETIKDTITRVQGRFEEVLAWP